MQCRATADEDQLRKPVPKQTRWVDRTPTQPVTSPATRHSCQVDFRRSRYRKLHSSGMKATGCRNRSMQRHVVQAATALITVQTSVQFNADKIGTCAWWRPPCLRRMSWTAATMACRQIRLKWIETSITRLLECTNIQRTPELAFCTRLVSSHNIGQQASSRGGSTIACTTILSRV